MLKKSSFIVVALVIPVLLIGCALDVPPELVVDKPIDVVDKPIDVVDKPIDNIDYSIMPDDFWIIFEQGRYFFQPLVPLLDTKNNIRCSQYVYDKPEYLVFLEYNIPREKLQEIYDSIIRYDIKSLSTTETMLLPMPHPYILADPPMLRRITFCMYGEIYSIYYEVALGRYDNIMLENPSQYRNLGLFAGELLSFLCIPDWYW